MFSTLESIKNSLFSGNVFSGTTFNPIHTIRNIFNNENDETNSLLEDAIENPDPMPHNEPERANIYDKRPYTVINPETNTQEDFHYLHTEQLSQSYDFCLHKSGSLKTHLCIVGVDFYCHYDGEHLPFLRFLMENKDNTIRFPYIEIMCSIDEATEDIEGAVNNADTRFQNECKMKLLDFFAIEENFSGDFGQKIESFYRGYKEIGENEIVAVFDITSILSIPVRTSKNPIWIVVDDFIQQVLPISPKVLQFFEENKYMNEIHDPNNNLVELPKTAYLYDMEKHDKMVLAEKSAWLEPRSLHPSYGKFYYMTALGNSSPLLTHTYRKCIVFLKNYADFLPMQGEPAEMAYQNDVVGGTASHESSPNMDITQDDIDVDPNVSAKQVENVRHSSIDEDMQHTLPFISLIMFMEKGELVYCVKTESIFCEL
jgi:hypothetical protein